METKGQKVPILSEKVVMIKQDTQSWCETACTLYKLGHWVVIGLKRALRHLS